MAKSTSQKIVQPGLKAIRINLEGVIQGVGFRPFVYKLAQEYHLQGFVYNSGKGVVIEVEGQQAALDNFLTQLIQQPPALATISGTQIERIQPIGRTSFEIVHSQGGVGKKVLIPPDVALCPDCRRELLDPHDRHFHYPFTNCTNCGPRFTIVRDLPYDRAQTSMAEFPMCDQCAEEYHNPADRRFHAQPVACPVCGPQLAIVGRDGRIIAGQIAGQWAEQFRDLIREGQILALKGLGGFHLTCDALNEQAVAELRKRKRRPAKPLAVMARDLDVIRKYCRLTSAEAQVLQSLAAPIVILDKESSGHQLPELLAPGVNTLGVMLPYTPLHMLLFDEQIELLVMTSGNASGLPLAKDNDEAIEQLNQIADSFVLHNRPIINRCDDSLVRLNGEEVQLYRRSRGYVPQYLTVPAHNTGLKVLGLGSEMKNTFCLLKENRAFLSQHIGEMESLENIQNYLTSLENFQRLTDIVPQVCGYDSHPDYQVSQLVPQLPCPAIPVQHHHAHLASCMAENGLEDKVLGLILDGTGYGLDGNLWGFEILAGDYLEFERLIQLRYLPLPGGDGAVRNPWRTAIAYLEQAFGSEAELYVDRLFPEYRADSPVILNMLRQRINTPLASSCGRLFDAVAALLGVCRQNTYDGQAAIELGELAAAECTAVTAETAVTAATLSCYPFEITEQVLDPSPAIREIVDQLQQGIAKTTIAARFQLTIVKMLTTAAEIAREKTGLNQVVLSGGSWQNQLMFNQTRQTLQDKKFQVYYHTKIPANDGGLALGQAMIARRRWIAGVLSNTGQSSGNF